MDHQTGEHDDRAQHSGLQPATAWRSGILRPLPFQSGRPNFVSAIHYLKPILRVGKAKPRGVGLPMKRRVVITVFGAVSPNGIGREAFWQATRLGKSGKVADRVVSIRPAWPCRSPVKSARIRTKPRKWNQAGLYQPMPGVPVGVKCSRAGSCRRCRCGTSQYDLAANCAGSVSW